jgi:hypothetical protein
MPYNKGHLLYQYQYNEYNTNNDFYFQFINLRLVDQRVDWALVIDLAKLHTQIPLCL